MDAFMENGDFISVHFDSMVDFLSYENPWPENKKKMSTYIDTDTPDYYNSKRGSKGQWIGPTVSSVADVKRNALLGDNELYEKYLKQKISELRKATGQYSADQKQVIKSSKRRRTFGDFGNELDIHKVYQGQLDTAWSKTRREEVDREAKFVTLFLMINGNAQVMAVDTLWRSATALLLAEDLQRAGKQVQIIVGGPSVNVTEFNHRMCVSIVVKRYNEKLAVNRLGVMSNIGFYRTFCFAAKFCQPYKVESGLGRSVFMSRNFIPLQFRDQVESGSMRMLTVPAITSLGQAESAIQNLSSEFNGAKNATV